MIDSNRACFRIKELVSDNYRQSKVSWALSLQSYKDPLYKPQRTYIPLELRINEHHVLWNTSGNNTNRNNTLTLL